MRYNNNNTKITTDGRLVFTSKINLNIPESPRDIYVATETGDRMDTLAFQFYGDSNLWWIIAIANKIHGANIGFKDGTVLRIPMNVGAILNNKS